MASNQGAKKNLDWSRYGLGSENDTRIRGNGNTGGFVDLGNEYDYGAGGHQASGANELFAEEQVSTFSTLFVINT